MATSLAAPPSSSFISFKSDTPPEFLCPISGSLMADPVILLTGNTFKHACIENELFISINGYPLRSTIESRSNLASFPLQWRHRLLPPPLNPDHLLRQFRRQDLSNRRRASASAAASPSDYASATESHSDSASAAVLLYPLHIPCQIRSLICRPRDRHLSSLADSDRSFNSSRSTSRLRVFLFPINPPPPSPALLELKQERHRFVDALNFIPPPSTRSLQENPSHVDPIVTVVGLSLPRNHLLSPPEPSGSQNTSPNRRD